MNKFGIEFRKFKKAITKACRQKHGDVKVSVNMDDYGVLGQKPNIHVWQNNKIIVSYYPTTVRPKQVVQFIRHTDGV